MAIATLFVILALVCFILGAFGVVVPRVNLVSLGLAFITAGYLVEQGLLHL